MTGRPSTLLDLVTDSLAAYRATRLLVTDDIIATTRDEIVRTAYIRAGRAETVYDEIRADRSACEQAAALASDVKDACSDIIDLAERGGWSEYARNDIAPPAVAQLVTCPWCMGVHAGLIIETVRALSRRRRPDPLRALALAAAAALITGLERS